MEERFYDLYLGKYSRRDRGLSIQVLNEGRILRFRAILGTDIYPWKIRVINPDSTKSAWFSFTTQEPRPQIDGVQLTQLQSGNWILAIASELISSRSKIKFDDKFGITNQVIYSSNNAHAVPKSIFAEIPNKWVANAPDTVQIILQNGGADDPMSKPYTKWILNEIQQAQKWENKIQLLWVGIAFSVSVLGIGLYLSFKQYIKQKSIQSVPIEESISDIRNEQIATKLTAEDKRIRQRIEDAIIVLIQEEAVLSVSSLASKVGMHQRTLQRHTLKIFNCVPSELIAQRIEMLIPLPMKDQNK